MLAIGGGTYVHDIPGGVAFGCAMPGVDNRMHEPDEFAILDDLVLSAKMFAQAFWMCAGEPGLASPVPGADEGGLVGAVVIDGRTRRSAPTPTYDGSCRGRPPRAACRQPMHPRYSPSSVMGCAHATFSPAGRRLDLF